MREDVQLQSQPSLRTVYGGEATLGLGVRCMGGGQLARLPASTQSVPLRKCSVPRRASVGERNKERHITIRAAADGWVVEPLGSPATARDATHVRHVQSFLRAPTYRYNPRSTMDTLGLSKYSSVHEIHAALSVLLRDERAHQSIHVLMLHGLENFDDRCMLPLLSVIRSLKGLIGASQKKTMHAHSRHATVVCTVCLSQLLKIVRAIIGINLGEIGSHVTDKAWKAFGDVISEHPNSVVCCFVDSVLANTQTVQVSPESLAGALSLAGLHASSESQGTLETLWEPAAAAAAVLPSLSLHL